MTTNQTIDGVLVSRELLADCVAYLQGSHRAEVNICIRLLRDLLERDADRSAIPGAHEFKDAPLPTKADYQRLGAALNGIIEPAAQPQGDPVGSFDKHMQYMQENIDLKKRIAELESSKPQGEPVAWQYRIVEDGKPLFNPLKKDGWIDTVEGVAKDIAERPSLSESRHYEVRKLYAEQLAPVAECAHEWRTLHQDRHVTITGCRKCQRFMEGQGTY